jgi:hypothetical protein
VGWLHPGQTPLPGWQDLATRRSTFGLLSLNTSLCDIA